MVSEPNSAACEEARALLSKFLHEGLKQPDDRVFRSHLTTCRECSRNYRETMATAAGLGHAMRTSRVDRERTLRREKLRASALEAGKPRKPGRRFGLRLMLLPAAVIVLLTMGPRLRRTEPLILHWAGGEVRAAGTMLNADRPDFELEVGDWCHTKGNARASIDSVACSFELGLLTQVMVENEGRLRLQQGELLGVGQLTISSAFGVLEMEEGSAVMRVHGAEVELECRTGELTWTDPTGRRSLSAGERL